MSLRNIVRAITKYPTGLVLWFLFWLVGIAAPLVALARLVFFFDTKAIGRVFTAQDRVVAATLGYDGRSTVSKECGRDLGCRFCKAVCAAMDALVESKHCEVQLD